MYKILSAHTVPDLVKLVNAEIEKGFLPVGGVCVYHLSDLNPPGQKVAVYQAMIKS
ncbi:hypothetical protein DmAi_18750 [Acetobacter persici]|uniref:DUF1737 domain-containing protein n=1 Tax=Acetobacter persici TaxID=1076596 RepID=A0A6V8IB31_9PROT|nr:hypothetical protein DmAi_18750 [Acetobacter persici]